MEIEAFELPSGAGMVALRGLSGFEVMLSRKKYGTDDEIGRNVFMLSCGMGIGEGEALHWMQTHIAGDFVAVTDRLQVISGLKPDAGKETYKSFRGEPDRGVLVLPSGEDGDAGSSPAAGTE